MWSKLRNVVRGGALSDQVQVKYGVYDFYKYGTPEVLIGALNVGASG